MIARLHGVLHEKSPEQLVVDVGGVGYQVFVSLQTFYRLPEAGDLVSLFIHTHTREDTLQLFGFLDAKEKAYFLLLRGVSGIGPRLALNILSGIPADELEAALQDRDVTRLVATPGVGRKTAERLVVELQGKAGVCVDGTDAPRETSGRSMGEAVSALVNLGYKRPQAEKTVGEIMRRGEADLANVIRESLRRLGG